MTMPILNAVSETTKGILLIITGTILLLHTLGIIQKGLDGIIIILAIVLMAIGFIKIRIDKIVMQKLKAYRSKSEK